MSIRVGIIGTGLIGEDHGRKLVNVINGSTVSAVCDVHRARAEEVAGSSADRPSSTTGTTSSRAPTSTPCS